MSQSPSPSAAELGERAQTALPRNEIGLRLSPLLPAAWPPASAAVEWLAYRSEPLPTGVIAYKWSGPVSKVTLALSGGEPHAETISDGAALGREGEESASMPDLGPAQQALLDVVLGRRAPDSARAELAAYARWAATHPAMGADLRRRKPEFFRWLDAAKP